MQQEMWLDQGPSTRCAPERNPTIPTHPLLGPPGRRPLAWGGNSHLENPKFGISPHSPLQAPHPCPQVPIACVAGRWLCCLGAGKGHPQRVLGTRAPQQRGPSLAGSTALASNWCLVSLEKGEREELSQAEWPQERAERCTHEERQACVQCQMDKLAQIMAQKTGTNWTNCALGFLDSPERQSHCFRTAGFRSCLSKRQISRIPKRGPYQRPRGTGRDMEGDASTFCSSPVGPTSSQALHHPALHS